MYIVCKLTIRLSSLRLSFGTIVGQGPLDLRISRRDMNTEGGVPLCFQIIAPNKMY